MNEKIKQLAEQAGVTVLTTHGMDHVIDGCYVIGPARLEKFAEQIVLECCQMMVDLEGKYPANLTVREIKQHFGITVKQHAAV